MRLTATSKTIVLTAILLLVVLLQYQYDATRIALPASSGGSLSPLMIRAVDMGFHPVVASFLWATTMPEILDLFRGRTEYFGDLSFLTAIDPKLSYPYAFSVLTLPAVPVRGLADGIKQAAIIGQEGLHDADPDWRIPYYLAMNYYLGLKDSKDALWYFDIAARTPGVPQYAERFALNFGIGTNERQKTEELWATIRDTTNDQFTKDRAQAYIDRLRELDYLDAATKQYKKEYGAYPSSTDALVQKGIIPSVPQDPFGFSFIINPDGTADVDLTKLPSYISAQPQQ